MKRRSFEFKLVTKKRCTTGDILMRRENFVCMKINTLRALKMTSPLGVFKQKEMKNDKGREGSPNIEKMGRRCLWMAPKTRSHYTVPLLKFISNEQIFSFAAFWTRS